MGKCIICDQPLPHGQSHPNLFGYTKGNIPEADNLYGAGDAAERMLSYTRVIFHALFCVWHYETESTGKLQYESVEPLTELGQDLCEEIDQRVKRLHNAGKIWQDRFHETVLPTEGPPPPPPDKKK